MTGLRPASKGFSLVELMVALLIGMIILAASVALMVNSKQSYTTQDSLARLQENARFAMQFLMRDIRMAGYYGCADDITSVKSWLNTSGGFSFNFGNRIEGSEAGGPFYPSNTSLSSANISTGATAGSIWPNTDAISMRMLDAGNPITLLSNMPQQSASLQVGLTNSLAIGDVIMLTDCSSADLFQITNLNASGGFDLVVHNTGTGSPGNDPANNPMKLSKRYQANSQIMKFVSVIYYIGRSTADTSRPALWRQTLVTNPSTGVSAPTNQELIEGIESLQITYGVDINGDRIPDYYVKADDSTISGSTPDWSKVVAVRVGILATTLANDSTPGNTGKQSGTDFDKRTYDVNGYQWPQAGDRTPGDRRQRRSFVSTIIPRNLQ